MLLEAIVSKKAMYRGRYIYFFHQVVQWCSAAAGSAVGGGMLRSNLVPPGAVGAI